MVTKLNSSAPAGDKEGGIMGWVIGLGLAAAAVWAGYEFWWKPKQVEKAAAASTQKEEQEEN